MPALARSRSDRMIAGVCAGLAKRFGMDPTVVTNATRNPRRVFHITFLYPAAVSLSRGMPSNSSALEPRKDSSGASHHSGAS